MKRNLTMVKIRLTPKQIEKLKNMTAQCAQAADENKPIVIYAQLRTDIDNSLNAILVDNETAQLVAEVMRKQGYFTDK